MAKRRLFLLVGFVALVGLVLGVMAMLTPTTGVAKANFDRVQKGMTKAEVEGIFGGKGEVWDTFWMRSDADIMKEMTREEIHEMFVREEKDGGWFIMRWGEHDGARAGILIQNDCVVAKQWFGSDETFLHRIRRWLHLQ